MEFRTVPPVATDIAYGDIVRAERAKAEAAEVAWMLEYRDAQIAEIERRYESPLVRRLERSGIPLEIAHALDLSERQAWARLCSGDRVRRDARRVWTAFRHGVLDFARVRAIASTLEQLERPESWERLDDEVVQYAPGRTVAELNAWLKRFVVRVEADLAQERAEEARAKRSVEIEHTDDGMAWINAFVPSPMAAAIRSRLTREAKALGSDDGRTLEQREADLFVSWLTTNEGTSPRIVADIAVTLPAATLTGEDQDGFVQASDGSWVAPASWVLEPEIAGQAFWHRLIVDPITDDVLAHEYVGRFAPETLAKAVMFRDGVCQAPHCRVPASRCDLDHRQPWPEGRTSGDNIWALCRRHHSMKGHRVITWTLSSGAEVPAESARSNPPTTYAWSPFEFSVSLALGT